jgi:hypothetical protein
VVSQASLSKIQRFATRAGIIAAVLKACPSPSSLLRLSQLTEISRRELFPERHLGRFGGLCGSLARAQVLMLFGEKSRMSKLPRPTRIARVDLSLRIEKKGRASRLLCRGQRGAKPNREKLLPLLVCVDDRGNSSTNLGEASAVYAVFVQRRFVKEDRLLFRGILGISSSAVRAHGGCVLLGIAFGFWFCLVFRWHLITVQYGVWAT